MEMKTPELHKYQKFVLLAEILALLHDLGKVNDPCEGTYPYRNHLQVLQWEMGWTEFDDSSKNVTKMVTKIDNSSFQKFSKLKWLDITESWGMKEVLLENELIKEEGERGIGYTALQHHFYKKKYRAWANPDTVLKRIIAQSDNIDSAEDRTSKINYPFQSPGVCNAFGELIHFEQRGKNQKNRKQFYEEWENLFKESQGAESDLLERVIAERSSILEMAQKHWSFAPAMSTYPDNDTSVWDHCYGTASIAKVILNGVLNDLENLREFKTIVMSRFKNKYGYYLFTFASKDLAMKLSNNIHLDNDKIIISVFDLGGKKFVGRVRKNTTDQYYCILKVQIKDNTKLNVNTVRNLLTESYQEHKDQIKKATLPLLKGRSDSYLNLFENRNKGTSLLDCLIGRPNVLAIQYPGRDYHTQVHRLPDFLGRKRSFTTLKNDLVKYLEEKLALGNLIYEDINGMYFIVPHLDAEYQKSLQEDIIHLFNEKLDGEILPSVTFSPCALIGRSLNFGKVIVKAKKKYETNLKKKLPRYQLTDLSQAPKWMEKWQNGQSAEICHICGRRPVVDDRTHYQNEKACKWCLEMRFLSSAKDENAGEPNKTKNMKGKSSKQATYIDQIQDENNKLALLVGDFGLFDRWLSGDYIQTNVNDQKNGEGVEPKKPSPSRLRALISTMDHFFTTVDSKLKEAKWLQSYSVQIKFNLKVAPSAKVNGFFKMMISEKMLNKAISANHSTGKLTRQDQILLKELLSNNGQLGLYIYPTKKDNSYEAIVTQRISLYDPEQEDENFDNNPDRVSDVLTELISKINQIEPDDGGQPILIDKGMNPEIKVDSSPYTMVRQIYGLADEFMVLVPANRVLEIQRIFEETFNEQFSKARGLLSLNLGTIFFDHKYPLYLIFDAAKRMLKEFRECAAGKDEGDREYRVVVHQTQKYTYEIEANGQRAKVIENVTLDPSENDCKTYQQLKLKLTEGIFENQTMTYCYPTSLEIANHKFMPDQWFTKVILLDAESEGRSGQLKNVSELKAGQEILFVPNIFDFQLVNATEPRLQIAVDPQSGTDYLQRKNSICTSFATRPFFMGNLQAYVDAFEIVKRRNVSNSALHHLQEQWIRLTQELFLQGSDTELYAEFADVLLPNIGNLAELDNQERSVLMGLLRDGSYFDFMELLTKHRIFDWKEALGSRGEVDE